MSLGDLLDTIDLSLLSKRNLNKLINSKVDKVKKEYEEQIESLNKGSLEKMEEVARTASQQTANNLNREFKETLSSIKREFNNPDKADPFYEGLYESYFGKDNKYSLEKLPEHIKESVKYSKSKGYITVYNSPISRTQPDELREYTQDIAYARAFEDPIIGSIPDSLQRFVLGRGLKFRCPDETIQSVLDVYWKKNNMEIYAKDLTWLLTVESEYFPLYFINDITGEVKIREIQPTEVKRVETDPDDKGTLLSYERIYTDQEGTGYVKYYADINYYEGLENGSITTHSIHEKDEGWQGRYKLVQFIKLMHNREVRGRVFLERVLRWAEFYKNWIIDRAIINHEKGRVVWILTLKGTREDTWERYMPAPAGGTVKISTSDREWSPVNAKIDASDAKEDGLFLLYQVAAGAGIPIHVLTQRTTENVYSSIRASDSPFSQLILDFQDTLADGVFRPMFRLVLRSAINAPNAPIKLKKTVKIKKYVKEYLRDVFRSQYDRYVSGNLSDQMMLRTIKTLTESYINDIQNSKYLGSAPAIISTILKECVNLRNLCSENTTRLVESRGKIIFGKHKMSKDILIKAFEVFENGIEVEVNTEDVPIEIVFPDMVREDLKQAAEILQIHRNLGIVSKTTASSKAGYNPEQEKYLLNTEMFDKDEEVNDDTTGVKSDDSSGGTASGEDEE